MQTPRNQTLAEALYRDIDKNDYLKEIYESLLYDYSINLFKLRKQQKEINIEMDLTRGDIPGIFHKHEFCGLTVSWPLFLLKMRCKTNSSSSTSDAGVLFPRYKSNFFYHKFV